MKKRLESFLFFNLLDDKETFINAVMDVELSNKEQLHFWGRKTEYGYTLKELSEKYTAGGIPGAFPNKKKVVRSYDNGFDCLGDEHSEEYEMIDYLTYIFDDEPVSPGLGIKKCHVVFDEDYIRQGKPCCVVEVSLYDLWDMEESYFTIEYRANGTRVYMLSNRSFFAEAPATDEKKVCFYKYLEPSEVLYDKFDRTPEEIFLRAERLLFSTLDYTGAVGYEYLDTVMARLIATGCL